MMREQNMERSNVEDVKTELEQLKMFRSEDIEPRISITATCTELLTIICC